MYRLINSSVFMAVLMVFTLGLTGCDTPAQFQTKNPKEAVVIEDVVEFMEKLAQTEADNVLKLPDGSLQMVFDHKLFVVPAETVAQAKEIGITIPAATTSK